ncbi:hypothetical protein E1287_37680 [Actinomadura sp. KC06]|uniref:Rmf/CrpP fold protein n=1 Tax=Actinomadura sp. KC06 TaxID=2530369 RepID=UPI00104E5D16|nr:Rmf/CrpP fold protein [Actinomadura sp. KC06]TDD24995.1 hypothetical protein E1287_37680 [Actinomadura sp. KC06]
MNQADAVRAVTAGRVAARNNEPATACPHDPNAKTPQERALARLWLRGYDRENPLNIDYS